MKNALLSLLLVILFLNLSWAQKHSFSIHLSNPIALFQKAGIKLEYKTSKIGLLLAGTQYYGNLPRYPGTQLGVETRFYRNATEKREDYIYGKILGGYQQAVAASGDGFFRREKVDAGNYYGAGIGLGRRYHFNHLFLDLQGGLKYTQSDVPQADAFYITGPGSFLDLHLNFGFQF